jgi:hypothetical protein
MRLWDCLALIKQSFVHAMAPAYLREQWLKQYDLIIHGLIQQWLNYGPCLPPKAMP